MLLERKNFLGERLLLEVVYTPRNDEATKRRGYHLSLRNLPS